MIQSNVQMWYFIEYVCSVGKEHKKNAVQTHYGEMAAAYSL